jgi:hypothetical protein
MFCRYCGSAHPEDSSFCPSCGKSVASATAPTSAGTTAAAPAPAAFPAQAMPAKYEKERKILIGGIIVAVIVAAVALILYLKSSSSDGSSQRDSDSSPASTMVTENLKRSRRASNQAAAAAYVRTLVSAQMTFSITYPSVGYANGLAQLGPGGETCVAPHPDATNACLIDFRLGCPEGVSGVFCQKDNYKYEIAGIGPGAAATDFVILATPVDREAGSKDMCATADGILRWRDNANPPAQPLGSVQECRAWEPI